MNKKLEFCAALRYNIAEKKKEFLRGRVQFPTGGIVRDPRSKMRAADLVQFQNRQYSLDERRKSAVFNTDKRVRPG